MEHPLPRARVQKVAEIAPHNIHGPCAAFRCELTGPGDDMLAGAVDGSVVAQLSTLLPGLDGLYRCGRPGSTSLAHLVEHLCLELQTLAGSQLECVRANGPAVDSQFAIVPFETENVCNRALRWVNGALSSLSGSGEFDLREGLQEFLDYAGRKSLPAQDRILIASARQRGVPVASVAGRTFVLGHGLHQRRISATKTSRTNIVSNDLAANKDYARRILRERGLPVPEYARVYSRRAALAAAKRIGFPVVLKPIFGSMGRGVTVGVADARELRAAYRKVRTIGRSVLVEEMVPGNDYRILIIDGRMVAAARRVPGHIVGDGRSNVRELIEQVNRHPLRGHDHNAPLTRIELDDQAEMLLAARGYQAGSIPARDEVVFLRRNANLSTGGTSIDVTDDVHPETRHVAERAARAIGLDIAGVDLLTTDISRSLYETGGKICEINSRPGIRKHIWPVEGKPRDVTGPIVDMLFPDGSKGRIPTVVVAGGEAAELCAQMVAHILHGAERSVGLGCAGRSWTRGRENRRTDRLTAPELVRGVLLDPDVDVAVLQVDPSEVATCGLGTDSVDITALPDSGALPEASAGIELLVGSTNGLVILGESLAKTERITALAKPAELKSVPETDSVEQQARSLATSIAQRLGIDAVSARRALKSFAPQAAGAGSIENTDELSAREDGTR